MFKVNVREIRTALRYIYMSLFLLKTICNEMGSIPVEKHTSRTLPTEIFKIIKVAEKNLGIIGPSY